MSRRLAQFFSDARHFQILALSVLLAFNIGWLDFGALPLNSALAIGSALAMQLACARFFKLAQVDLRSPLITGLSLSLLLRADDPWLHAAAGAVAILSKFVLRIDGKHVFNPAGFAIVALLLTSNGVWISPGQWGTALWFSALVAFLAILVLRAARRADIAVFFLGSHAALLLARALWLGDPLAIPLHQVESGSLLIFAFFMISDPRTSPDSRLGRLLLAVAVAVAGHWLAFFMQMRPALYFALIALSPLTFLIDRIIPAERFTWSASAPTAAQGASR
jgi:Na+-transporting NADH:ubiquinone oxidoreductase subunit NqrB